MENLKWDKNRIQERVDGLLKMLKISELDKRYPSELSGGQQQRLALARAFASNRPILILDDTTSALDNRTEKLILKSLDFMRHQSTQFLITQRVSTASAADLILVLNEGDIIEKGNHDSLLKKDGFYAKLYNSQFEL